MTDHDLKSRLQQHLHHKLSTPRPNRLVVTVPREELRMVAETLSKEGIHHLSTITARDTGTSFEVLYHFFADHAILTVHTSCPRDDATVPSIHDLFPVAALYEREFHDLLGIVPAKHPDLRPLVLPDDWEDGFPLRKDWKPKGGEIHA